MTQTDHWDRIRELFEEVSLHPPEERRDALRKLCPDDADLQNEVLSLLEHDEKAQPQFLAPLEHPIAASERDGPDPLVGTPIGKYQIQRVIAAGGMGTVYEASQEHPQRSVAVKVMHAWARSRVVRRRFEFEVEALGRLTHPNIARMYDADTIAGDSVAAGTPYFVMEYVPDARTIVDFANEKKLETRSRLELFAQACEAIHHGHLKGIIHRDLKPANILVDASGQVKVIDFGVARATDADVAATTQLTDSGQLLGTIQYMSPEQCAGDPRDLDVRTDVYSLGVVLYQLLCGRLPYSSPTGTLTQAIRAICDSLPVPPRTVNRDIRGNLEFILLVALQKDREKRYQSVADLSRDIRHYLNREPIEVRAASRIERVLSWARRHPVAATGMACLSVTFGIALGAGVSIWFALYRPVKVQIVDDGSAVQLVSIAGTVLHEWRSEKSHVFLPGGTLGRLVTVKGRTAAIIGFGREYSETTKFAGQLCAIDVSWSHRGTTIWCRGIESGDLPPNDRLGFKQKNFSPEFVWLVDAFDENPGPELVAVYAHDYSYRAIRVLTLDGDLLYQVWHDGLVLSCERLDASELLVFSGENSEVYWEDRDHPEAAYVSRRYPAVVFALRAHPHPPSSQLIKSTSGDGPLDPAWYRCLLPPKKADAIDAITLSEPVMEYHDGKHLRLTFHYIAPTETLAGIHIDERGSMVGPVLPGDAYNRNQSLPQLQDFYLGELPSIRSPAESRPQ